MTATHREFRCFGPPGTGKTTWLSRQITKAAEERGAHRVLACSFTRAAVTELNSRNLPIPPQNIGTLHALCYRGLDYPEIAETPKHFQQFSEAYPRYRIEEGTRSDADDGYASSSSSIPGDVLLQEYSCFRAIFRPPDMWGTNLKGFVKAWEDYKEQTGTFDFTDLIDLAVKDLDYPLGLPEVGFFDEAQDFTPLELKLVRKWGNTMETFVLAGDDDQSIYFFKGARPDVMLSPLPKDNIRILKQSYRVPRSIHKVAEDWIKKIPPVRRQLKAYMPREEEGAVFINDSNYRNTQELIRMAKEYAREGLSCFFLASCGYMLHNLITELREGGVPFSNPYRRRNRAWNPLHRYHDQTSSLDRCLAFMAHLQHWEPTWTRQELETWLPLTTGVKQWGWRRVLGDLDMDEEIPPDRLPRILKANLENVWEHHLDWLTEVTKGPAKRSVEFAAKVINNNDDITSLTQEPLIRVGTIHSVKGGEADVVFLFPDLSVRAARMASLYTESKESVVRQFYVGMTRARKILYLCKPVAWRLSSSMVCL